MTFSRAFEDDPEMSAEYARRIANGEALCAVCCEYSRPPAEHDGPVRARALSMTRAAGALLMNQLEECGYICPECAKESPACARCGELFVRPSADAGLCTECREEIEQRRQRRRHAGEISLPPRDRSN